MADEEEDIIGRVVTHGTVGKCPWCGCDMTYPSEAPERLDGDEDRLATEFPWIAESFCPNCEQVEIVRMKYEVMASWKAQQDAAKEACTKRLDALAAYNESADAEVFATQAEAFVVALESGHILPMDFHA